VPEPEPEPEPEVEVFDNDGWPELPNLEGQITNDLALQVIDLLEGKHISYDIAIDGTEGTISASSFNEKELLKASGFRWSSEQKRWIFRFRNEPF